MSLAQFIDDSSERKLSLLVVNRESPEPFQSLLERIFDEQSITVQEERLPDEEQDTVFLVDEQEVIASSPLSTLQDAMLLVNSDLYVTGARNVEEVTIPDVIDGLEGVPFRLSGYPKSNKEKLLLITMSRYIERLALESDGGTLRAAFQRLSRINDERGTRKVYEKLAISQVDTHVYGVPDWTPSPGFDVTMHGGWADNFRDSWFVTFVPDGEAHDHAAMVAVETDPQVWEGFWTYDVQEVRQITRFIRHEL